MRLTMLCLSGFELYPRWVPLKFSPCEVQKKVVKYKKNIRARED